MIPLRFLSLIISIAEERWPTGCGERALVSSLVESFMHILMMHPNVNNTIPKVNISSNFIINHSH